VSTLTADGQLRDEFEPGYQLGVYTLLERLGFGGQATVWSALNKRQKRVVAIKFIPSMGDYSLAEPSTYMREAQIVSSLEHPNILPLYDIGLVGNFDYLVMRYICCGSLQDLVRSGPIPLPDVSRLATQISTALQYIHARGIVHRDLKPRNILLDSQKRAFLTDFGLARPLSGTTQPLHTGQGTAPYSPPEQHTKAQVAYTSDIYSLGIMFYEMLTGKLPWNGQVALAIRQLGTDAELPDPRDINPALPPSLVAALRKLTARDPANRPTSALKALNLVEKTLKSNQTRDTVNLTTSENIQGSIDTRLDDDAWTIGDAESLLRRAITDWDPWSDKYDFKLTHFMLVDGIYPQAERHGLTFDDPRQQFMLRGAFTYGHNLEFWWKKVADSQARLQVCEQTIANESEESAERALSRILDEPTTAPQSESTQDALIDLAATATEPRLRSGALDVLGRQISPSSHWQKTGFTLAGDKKLAKLALEDNLQAKQAAHLIGQAHSETAVLALLAQDESDAAHLMPILTEIRAVAGSLPRSIPTSLRVRVGAELGRRQLLEDQATLLRAYLVAALGSALGLGFHVYMTYRLPSFLDRTRILNAIGSGLLFGLLIGLGIFLTRLAVDRLKVLPLVPRIILSTIVGTLIVNLGMVSYHNLFLSAAPAGGLIAMGSAIMAFGFSAATGVTRSRWVRMLLSTAAVALGIGLSWRLAMGATLTPMLYYEMDRPEQTIFLIAVTSLLVGATAHVVDLLKHQEMVGRNLTLSTDRTPTPPTPSHIRTQP
jgi:serine/threonine protein kinase